MTRAVATLSPAAYRWTDRLSKLLGVGLVAGGLHVGGGTSLGLALGAAGVALGTITVFLDHDQ